MTNSDRAKNYRKSQASLGSSSNATKKSGMKNSDRAKAYMEKKRGVDSADKAFTDRQNLYKRASEGISSVTDFYSGWNNTDNTKARNNAKAILNEIQSYKSKNGTSMKLDQLEKFYSDAVRGWDDQQNIYSQYKTADAFNSDVKRAQWAQNNKGLTYEQVQQKLRRAEGDEAKYLSEYGNLVGYNTLEDYDKDIAAHGGNEGGLLGVKPKHTEDTKGTWKQTKEQNKYLDRLEVNRNLFDVAHRFDKYASLMQNADFAKNSAYNGDGNYQNRWINDEEFRKGDLFDISQNGGSSMGVSMQPSNPGKKAYDFMTNEERSVYNYIYNTQGEDAAEEYLDDMQKVFEKRKLDEQTKAINDKADEGFASSAAMAANRLLTNGAYGAMAGVGLAKSILSGEEYDPYGYYASGANINGVVDEAISENIAEKFPNASIMGVNVPAFLYQTGMSAADSLIGASTLGAAYTPLMGLSAFQSTAKELSDKGVSYDKMLATAASAGIAEALFEKFSIEALLSDKSVSKMANFLKQFVTEGSEEVATELANIFSDYMINGGASEYSQMYDELIERGYTPSEAKAECAKQIGGRLAEAGIGGALAGGLSSPIASARYYHNASQTGKAIRNAGNAQSLIDTASNLDADTDAYKSAEYLSGKKNVKNYQLGTLYDQTLSEVQGRTEAETKGKINGAIGKDLNEAVSTMLNARGINDADLTTAIVKSATNQKLTKFEKALINNSVASDVIESIKSGNVKFESTNQDKLTESIKDIASLPTVSRNVASIESSEDGYVVTREDGTTVDIKTEDLTKDDSLLLENASEINDEERDVYLRNYDSRLGADIYNDIYNAIYDAGKNVTSEDAYLSSATFNVAVNTIGMRGIQEIWNKGFESAKADAEKSQQIIDREVARLDDFVAGDFDESAIKGEKLSSKQKKLYSLAKALSSLGMSVKLINDASDFSKNGAYYMKENYLMVNLSARYGLSGNDKVSQVKYGVNTIAHEITHSMKVGSPSEYLDLKKAIVNLINNSGRTSWNAFVNMEYERGLKSAEKEGKTFTLEEAEDEAVARACEDMLNDPDKLKAALLNCEEGSIEKIKNTIMDFFERVKKTILNILKGYESNAEEARILRDIDGAVDEVREIWAKAFAETMEAHQVLKNIGVELSDGVAYTELNNEKTFDESIYSKNVDEAVNILSLATGRDKSVCKKWIEDVRGIADVVRDDEKLQYEVAQDLSAWVSNPEYGGSLDYSFLCPKRLVYTGTLNEILSRNKNYVPTVADFLALRNILLENGQEAPCSYCFVESARARFGKYNKEFINRSKEMDLSYVPTAEDLANPDKLEKMKEEHRETFDAYVKYLNSLSQRKPKMLEKRRAYDGHIIRDAFKNDTSVESKNLHGGIRFNSFSDQEVVHILDNMQAVLDMASVGLAGFGYTKQAMFVKAFGQTGLKINLSCAAKGVDENGRIIFDDVEGMNHKEALTLRNDDRYSKNVGITCVVFTKDQLKAALADDRIDYVLPFHRSQWSKKDYASMGLPKNTFDFTRVQNERSTKENGKAGKKAEGGNIPFLSYWDFNLSGRENAQKYLDIINERNLYPLFDSALERVDGKWVLPDGAVGDGYYKCLVEFKMYDNYGNPSPQNAVEPIFDTSAINDILNEYDGSHEKFPVDMASVESFEKYLNGEYTPSIAEERDVMYSSKFDGENIEFGILNDGIILSKDVEPTEKDFNTLKEYAKWKEDYFYIRFKGSTNNIIFYDRKVSGKKLVEDIKNLYASNSSADGTTVADKVNIKPIDSDGKELTDKQIKKFGLSAVVDENGKLLPVYHGTVREFYTFDRSYANPEGDMGKGFYFTNNLNDVDENYANRNGSDFTQKVEREAEHIYDAMKYDEELAEEYDGMDVDEIAEALKDKYATSEEPITHKVYLDIKNPVYVGNYNGNSETILLGDIYDEISEDDYADEDEYQEALDELMEEKISTIAENLADAFNIDINSISEILYEIAYEGGYKLEDIKERFNDSYFEDENGNQIGNEVARALCEELGFDGIIDNTVSKKFRGMHLSDDTTHFIVFDSNQAKLTTNENPTDSDDVRYSLKDITYGNKDFFDNSNFFSGRVGKTRESQFIKVRDNKEEYNNTRYYKLGRGKTAYFLDDSVVIANTSQNPRINYIYQFDVEYLDTDKNMARINDWYTSLKESILDYERNNYATTNKALFANSICSTFRNLYTRDVAISILSRSGGKRISRFVTDSTGERYESAFYKPRFDSYREGFARYDESERFSSKVDSDIYELLGENERLKKENANLAKDIERLAERLALEKKVTGGGELNKRQLELVAGSILNMSRGTMDKAELTSRLEMVYSYILDNSTEGNNIDANVVMAMTNELARDILDGARPEVIEDAYSKRILADMRKTHVKLSDAQIAELKNSYGDDWKSLFRYKVVIDPNGISLDSMWQEWASKYPEIFKTDISDADEAVELLNVYDEVKDAARILQYYNDSESVSALASEIQNKFWNVSTVTTTADRYADKIKKLKYEHRQSVDALKESKKKAISDKDLADRIYYGKMIQKIRNQRDEKLQQMRERTKEMSERRIEEQKKRNLIAKITKQADTLRSWMKENSAKHHVPDDMKPAVNALLNAIDFSSKQLLGMVNGDNAYTPTSKDVSLANAMRQVNDIVQASMDAQLEGDFKVDFPPQYNEDVRNLMDTVLDIKDRAGIDNGYILQQMDSEDLKKLYDMITIMKHSVSQMNKLIASKNAHSVDYVAQETIQYANELGKKDKEDGVIKKFFNYEMALPYYYFKHLGKGGQEIFEEIQDGWDRYAFNIKALIDFTERTYTDKEVNAWKKDIKKFTVLEPPTEAQRANGEEGTYRDITMTVPQIMSLYCLSKREQAIGHIHGGGIRIDNYEDAKGKTIKQTEPVLITQSELANILEALTPRQIEVADRLQEFMNNEAAKWGNEVTMKRFGIAGFTEKNYFPIKSDSNVLATDPKDDAQSIYKLLNLSFTKSLTQNANNQILVGDIFSVWTNHCSDMAKYNSIALPVLDMIKWYNYKEKEDNNKVTSLKSALEDAYGANAKSYVLDFLTDLNGSQESGRGETIYRKLVKNYKVAMVAANLQVALLQPISYIRAFYLMDGKYLTRGLARKPQIEKCKNSCGIAQWKSLGFFDTNVSRGLDKMITHADTWTDKAIELSMKGAEFGDSLTWGYLYNACEEEIKDKTNLTVGSKEFEEAVQKRFREVVYATQVVDSTVTRSDIMRSKSPAAQSWTAFMSEPTVSYNMVMDSYTDMMQEARRTNFANAFSKYGRITAKAIEVYLLSCAVESILRTGVSLVRDPDDEDDMLVWNRLLEYFLDQINPFASIPILKEIESALRGYSTSRMDMAAFQNAYYAGRAWQKVWDGNGSSYKAIYRTLQSVSQLSGLPMSTPFRDVIAIWNNTVGRMYPDLKWE